MALPRLGHRWSPLAKRALDGMEASHLARAPVLDALAELFDHVSLWMDQADLCSADSPEELVDSYLADAALMATHTDLAGAAWVNPAARGGAPGLALALLRADFRMTLVDSDSRCVAFLRTLGSALAPGRTEALRVPVGALDTGSWHVAVTRSEEDAQDWLEDGTRLARSCVWLFLASEALPFRSGWRISKDLTYQLPLTGAPRRAVLYESERR